MRRALLVMLFMTSWVFVIAQKVSVTGSVTDPNGKPVPGASVREKGTKNGVSADNIGGFTITVGSGATLVISAAGFVEKEVSYNAANRVALDVDTRNLSEVVVTAQGIRRRPRELGVSVARVSNDDITVGHSPQLAQSLSGKVSGLAVFNVNNSVDPSVKITLRGYRSMTGNNDALLVIDGTPMPGSQTMLNLLNPNDIESISILKGGQAATLYGSAGVNGALVITTKKGVRGKAKVTFNNSTNFEEISFLPQFQDKYGSGSHYADGFGTAGWKSNYLDRMHDNWRPFENQQYGDAFNGEQRIVGRVLEDGSALVVPYSAIPGERKRIWNKGLTTNNQVAVSGGAENTTFYLSAESNIAQGIVPGDKSNRTGLRFSGSTEAGRLKTSYNVNYVQQNFDRTTYDFYFESLNQAANIPLSTLRDWRTNKFANPNGYYNDYYNNPFFRLDNERQKYGDQNFNGSVDASFKITNWLNLYDRVGMINNTRVGKNTVGKFAYSDWAKNSAYVPAPWDWANDYDGIDRAGTDNLGSVGDYSNTENIINNEFQLQANQDFKRFTVKGIVGMNTYQRTTKSVSVNSGSIVVPDVYNVGNRQGELGGGESNTKERKFGYYADGLVGFKDMVFLHGSFRYDATSRFYKASRSASLYSYPYYGVDASAVITDIIPSIRGKILSYAKLRASYNKNGNDNISLYGLDLTFNNAAGFPYGNTVGLSVGDVLPDANLKPEFVTSMEVGGEFQFLKNRISLDATMYKQKSVDQVLQVKIPNSTGYPNLLVNVGDTKNWGYEGDLKLQVIKHKTFSWDLNFRYSYNENKVTRLYQGVNQFSYGGYSYAQTYVMIDKPFPFLKTTAYVRDAATNRVMVNKGDGYPIVNTADLKEMGQTIPKHIAGLGTSVRYGAFTLTANAEYRGGNYMFSQLGRDMTFTGSGKWTEDRTPHVFPNSSYNDGTGKIVVNNDVQVQEAEYALWVDKYRLIAENFVNKAWFIKIRDANLSYSFAPGLVAKTKFLSAASISIYGRNLLTVVDKMNYYTDPEFSYTTGNGQGINNTGQTPPVRQYGFNVNLTFK